MPREFRLPDLAEGLHEAEIVEIHVSEGDVVQENADLLTVVTDKAVVEVPSPYSGQVKEIRVGEGDLVRVGDVMVVFSGEGQEPHTAEPEPVPHQATTQPTGEWAQGSREGYPVPAAPSTRRLARELEVDLHKVAGSGPGGRVTRDDVTAFANNGGHAEQPSQAQEPARTMEPAAASDLPDFTRWGQVTRQPLRSVRRITAQHMAQSWQQIPHVTHHDQADITDLEGIRREYKGRLELDSLTLTAFVLKAAGAALHRAPRFNASLDVGAGEIIFKHYIDIGVAVDTDRGLIVPVMRNIPRKSVIDIAVELNELVNRTRNGEARAEDMQGGTFTMTNIGPIGGTHFNPIINYPQAAILGMAAARWHPVVRGQAGNEPGSMSIEPRFILPLILAFDHRLADGAEAARFMADIITMLEDPHQMLLRT